MTTTQNLRPGSWTTCPECGTSELRVERGSRGVYLAHYTAPYENGARYPRGWHSPERCASAKAARALTASAMSERGARQRRAHLSAAILTRYGAAVVAPAFRAGTITNDEAAALLTAAIDRLAEWERAAA